MKKGSLKATLALAAAMVFGANHEAAAQQGPGQDGPDQDHIAQAMTTSCLSDNKTIGIDWIIAPSQNDIDSLTNAGVAPHNQLAEAFLNAAFDKLDEKLDDLFDDYTLEEIEAQISDAQSPFRTGLNEAIDNARAEVKAQTGIGLLIGSVQPIGVAPGCTPD